MFIAFNKRWRSGRRAPTAEQLTILDSTPAGLDPLTTPSGECHHDCNPTRLKTILDKAGGDCALFSVADGRDAGTDGRKPRHPNHETD